MRSLLLLAYFFPPSGGGGVQRSLRLVKGLHARGWRITVWSGPVEGYPIRDDSLAGGIPGAVRVERVPLVRVPGVHEYSLRWAAGVAHRSWQGLREEHHDVVIATGSPFFPFAVPALLRHRGAPPLLLDFRDAWTVDSWHPLTGSDPKARMYRLLARRTEAIALRRAERIVFAVPAAWESYRRAYPAEAVRMRLLPNGFDPEDFPGPPPGPPSPGGPIRIVAAGTFADFRFPRLLLDALLLLRSRRPALLERLDAELVGAGGNGCREDASRVGLGDRVGVRDYIPHREVPPLLRSAGILWFDNGPDRRVLSAKLFEYLAAGRPILAAAHPQGATAEILRRSGGAVVVPPEPQAVSRGIEMLVDRIDGGTAPLPDPVFATRFSLPAQAAEWEVILEEAISAGGEGDRS